jgi:hypothetical protein
MVYGEKQDVCGLGIDGRRGLNVGRLLRNQAATRAKVGLNDET